MLTLGEGLTVAQINGGALNDELVSIKQTNNLIGCGCCGRCSDKCFIKPCCKKCNRNEEDEDIDLGEEITIKDGGTIEFTPLFDQRDVIFLGAQSGSGKSTLIRKYTDIYHKIEPRNPILLFSSKTDEPLFKTNYIKQFNVSAIDIDQDYDLVNNPMFKNGGLVIFDDTNTIPNKKIRDKIAYIMHHLLEVGRAKKIYLAISYHMLNPNERRDSRVLWNESRGVVLFPHNNERAEEYALKEYLGFDNDTINKIMTLPTRWVMIRKIPPYPKVVIWERGVFIPKSKYQIKKNK